MLLPTSKGFGQHTVQDALYTVQHLQPVAAQRLEHLVSFGRLTKGFVGLTLKVKGEDDGGTTAAT